jgi:putative two-component system response regulator
MTHPDKILIIDEGGLCIEPLTGLLARAGYPWVRSVTDLSRTGSAYKTFQPDLVILDLMMVPSKGLEVVVQLKSLLQPGDYIPILIVTINTEKAQRDSALASGATDFIAKPFDLIEMILRVQILLNTRHLHLNLEQERSFSGRRLEKGAVEFRLACEEIYRKLSRVAEFRDFETGGHAKRVAHNAGQIAFALDLEPAECARIESAALLHDIGKIAIPDAILLKPGLLNCEEMELMRSHTKVGAEILGESCDEMLQMAEEIARTHHERWDGTGYLGLKGESIPLCGRIVSVADVMDALTSTRPYRERWTTGAAIAEINAGSGVAFDPRVVDAFNRVLWSGTLARAA